LDPVSLNQIEHTVRKAVRGCGFDWGIAEEAGRAVRWLEWMNLDGIGSLFGALDAVKDVDMKGLLISAEGQNWVSRASVMSPILAGPSLADSVGIDFAPICLHQLSRPLLAAGFIGAVLAPSDDPIFLQWPGVHLSVENTRLGVMGELENLTIECADKFFMSRQNDNVDGVFAYRQGVTSSRAVSSDLWHELEAKAHLTYVEATDASRLAGAGAGLSDND